MKLTLALLACLLAFTAPSFADKRFGEFDEAHRFIFYAVLEGCYEDGLASEDVAQILLRHPKECYYHFIYSCPICTPTIDALEAYRSRPKAFYSLKGEISTFGPGLSPELKKQLYSESTDERLTAINTLVQSWIARRFSQLALTDQQREELHKAIEEKRKKGTQALKSFKSQTFERGDYAGKSQALYYAPAFSTLDECAVCNAAIGKKPKLHDPQ